jgi:3-keto-L-gulonate-6-phosphate decarboxylase
MKQPRSLAEQIPNSLGCPVIGGVQATDIGGLLESQQKLVIVGSYSCGCADRDRICLFSGLLSQIGQTP